MKSASDLINNIEQSESQEQLDEADVLSLVTCIESINPGEKDKMHALKKLVNKLKSNYEAGVLPESVKTFLKQQIVPNIKQAIKDEKPEWLRDLYYIELDVIKYTLIENYFKANAKLQEEDLTLLNKQFAQVVEEVVNEHKHYRQYITDNFSLLYDMRFGNKNKDFQLLVDVIKRKMRKMPLGDAHENQALQSMLNKPEPTAEFQKLIQVNIVDYLKNLKRALNPLKLKQLEEYRVSDVTQTMFALQVKSPITPSLEEWEIIGKLDV